MLTSRLAISAGGYAVALVFFLLWRGAEKDLAAEILACNVDELEETIAAERAVRQAERDAAEQALNQERAMRLQAESARQALSNAVSRLEANAAASQDKITRLEYEASLDEIPSFADCSIVYFPRRVLYAENCTAAGNSGGPDYRVCVGPGGLNPTDSAFADITIGDSLKLWGRDRAALGQCNARLAAIAALGQ